jgi:hypothetical protein
MWFSFLIVLALGAAASAVVTMPRGDSRGCGQPWMTSPSFAVEAVCDAEPSIAELSDDVTSFEFVNCADGQLAGNVRGQLRWLSQR